MVATSELKHLINSFYGGSDGRTRHPFNRRFIYTEGVKAVADKVGAYWLLDILATEVAPICLKLWEGSEEGMTFFHLKVTDSKAEMWLNRDEGQPTLWCRRIEFTDFPDGNWVFYMAMDGIVDPTGDVLVMLLPSEY